MIFRGFMKEINTRIELHFDRTDSENLVVTEGLCLRIGTLLEEFRKDSVLSHNLGEEDSVDSIEVRVVDEAGGRYFLDIVLGVDSDFDSKELVLILGKEVVDLANELKCGGLLSDYLPDDLALVLVTEFWTKADVNFCKVCGKDFVVEGGVSGHVDALGLRDFDTDSHHTPYGLID